MLRFILNRLPNKRHSMQVSPFIQIKNVSKRRSSSAEWKRLNGKVHHVCFCWVIEYRRQDVAIRTVPVFPFRTFAEPRKINFQHLLAYKCNYYLKNIEWFPVTGSCIAPNFIPTESKHRFDGSNACLFENNFCFPNVCVFSHSFGTQAQRSS